MRRCGDNPVGSKRADELMAEAVEASRSTYPHPNPRVGAVLTSPDGEVLALAAHRAAGEAHAEILALEQVDQPSGLTLYVTLEPCNHLGRTPPCTEAIINAGIAQVVVGRQDPDARVSGKGIDRLRDAGIDVSVGILADEVVSNDPGYYHHRMFGTPRVTLKLAATLDGQVAAVDGTSQWITSPEARKDAHWVRSENDVIIVGAGTVIQDDPLLTVRLQEYSGPQPIPVVIRGRREIPSESKIFERDPIVYEPKGRGSVDPVGVVKDLGKRGFVSALIEGGPSIAGSFLRAGIVDEIIWYVAAKIAAGTGMPAIEGSFATMGDIRDITFTGVERLGSDIKFTATLEKEE